MNFKVLCSTILIIGLIQFIPLGLSIGCYQCEEQIGNQCEKNVRNVLTENCTASFVCVKYIWKDGNISTIHRSCMPESICTNQKALETANRTLSVCTTCNSTLCNSTEIVPIPSIVVLLSLSAILLLKSFLCT